MLIGILSDTHDDTTAMQKGMEALRAAGAEYYIHCGDVGGENIIDQLAGTQATFVWGNNDYDRVPLQKYAESLGIGCFSKLADLTLDGKRFAVTHGDDLTLKQKLLRGQNYDYVLHGHTHVRHDSRVGKTRAINPGALYRARVKSVALLDTQQDTLEFKIIDV